MLLPVNESFTTQAAAEFLGMSRPFLVGLIERDEIPHHRVGAHRRVYLKDLLAYMQQRDKQRKAALNNLAAEIESGVEHGKQHTVECEAGIEILLHQPHGIEQLRDSFERVVLALDGNEQTLRCRQHVEREQSE